MNTASFPRPMCFGLVLTALVALPASAQELPNFEELLPATQPRPDSVSAAAARDPEPEVIRERYDNRRVKIEREVVQDESQNYINHGKWKMWDRQGSIVVEGQFHYNQRDGVWTRIYRQRDAKLLTIAPLDQARLPLVSRASFQDGELHGKWIFFDADKRKLCEWNFADGRRHGLSTWWYVSGAKMREIQYTEGAIDGQLNEWDRGGQQVTRDLYENGRRLALKVDYFPDRSKKAEGMVLYPELVEEQADDWWECRVATYSTEGEPEKHGKWTSWYPNGQRKLEAQYQHDVPHGEFVWWHPNGQKSLQALYREGKKDGQWTWWHANGQKSIQGEYVNNDPSEKWLWWQENGKVAQRADFSEASQREMLAMPERQAKPESSSEAKANSPLSLK